jgi:two-component system sensor histidine kinase DesK
MRLIPDHPELGWTPYAWLIYLGFFLMYPVVRGAGPGEWAATLLGVAVFLVLYFTGYWQSDRGLIWIAAGLCLLGAVYAPFNTGSNVFFVYAMGFLGQLPARRALPWMTAVLLAVVAVSWTFGLNAFFWAPGLVFGALNGGINLHFASVSRANARLRVTQAEVERLAQTAERERIARDLHDVLGHTLSLITLKSELAAKLVPRDPARAEAEIRDVERISREALKEVRAAISGYRSEGLPAELARARLALETAGVRLESSAAPVELAPVEETVLSLALREAVTNVMRHARASSCRIVLEQTEEETRLEVHDDGGWGAGGKAGEGVGLSVMRERVEGLGGRLERRVDGGTLIAVVLPRRKIDPTEERAPACSSSSSRLAPEGA